MKDPYAAFTPTEKALLIAAAPALLGACHSILTTCEDLELEDIGALDDVREAIALAEGTPFKPYVNEVEEA